MMRALLVSPFAAVLLASSPPHRPAELAPYLDAETGRISDFSWQRGAFDEASAKDKAAYQAIIDWLVECQLADQHRVQDELIELGYPDADLSGVPLAQESCGRRVFGLNTGALSSYADAARALAEARPVFEASVASAARAQSNYGAVSSDLSNRLLHQTMTEQLYRHASDGLGRG